MFIVQRGEVQGIITDYSELRKIPMAKAIVKHYLTGHVKSDFRAIGMDELVVAALAASSEIPKAAEAAYIETAKRY